MTEPTKKKAKVKGNGYDQKKALLQDVCNCVEALEANLKVKWSNGVFMRNPHQRVKGDLLKLYFNKTWTNSKPYNVVIDYSFKKHFKIDIKTSQNIIAVYLLEKVNYHGLRKALKRHLYIAYGPDGEVKEKETMPTTKDELIKCVLNKLTGLPSDGEKRVIEKINLEEYMNDIKNRNVLFEFFKGDAVIDLNVFKKILDYVPRTIDSLDNIGLVNRSWYINLLLNWGHVRVCSSNVKRIPILVYKTLTSIKLVEDMTKRFVKSHLKWFFKKIDFKNIVQVEVIDKSGKNTLLDRLNEGYLTKHKVCFGKVKKLVLKFGQLQHSHVSVLKTFLNWFPNLEEFFTDTWTYVFLSQVFEVFKSRPLKFAKLHLRTNNKIREFKVDETDFCEQLHLKCQRFEVHDVLQLFCYSKKNVKKIRLQIMSLWLHGDSLKMLRTFEGMVYKCLKSSRGYKKEIPTVETLTFDLQNKYTVPKWRGPSSLHLGDGTYKYIKRWTSCIKLFEVYTSLKSVKIIYNSNIKNMFNNVPMLPMSGVLDTYTDKIVEIGNVKCKATMTCDMKDITNAKYTFVMTKD